MVIADLTDRNPNVFYELGVRHALRNATILITQDESHIPFDLIPYMTILYNWKLKSGKDDFKQKIKAALKQIENNPDSSNVISPVRKYLKLES